MRSGRKGGTSACVMSRANLVLSLVMKPAVGSDGVVPVVTVTIMVIVMMVVMVVITVRVDRVLIVDSVVRRKLHRRVIAPAQPQQCGLSQLPHLFFLALAEILATLALPAACALALPHLIRVLLFDGLSLAGKFGTELIAA
jgi:hypothetical protein